MFFYRELPPSNVPPNVSDLRFWFDGKNIDGSSNSTLTDGQPNNLETVANLGSAGGSWVSSDNVGGNYRPLYRASTPSIQIGTVGGFNRSLGLLSFDQPNSCPSYNFTNSEISGFIVFSLHTSITNNGLLWMSIDPAANYWNTGMNANSATKFNMDIRSTPVSFDFAASTGVRYCLSWKRTASGHEFRIKSSTLITQSDSSGPVGAVGPWNLVLGARTANGTPQNAYVESFGVYEGNIDMSQVETWVENYYGTLG